MNMPTVDAPDNTIEAHFGFSFSGAVESGFSLQVDLRLPGNGITAIYGVSGSGKSTLLRCIAGLEQPESGLLTVRGEQWLSQDRALPTHKRPLGYVFQETSLFPHLSVEDNLRFAEKRCVDGADPTLRDRVLATLGIEDLLARNPSQLSGGQRQRVAIARALLIKPQLLLMDEPLASLDYQRKQEILPYLEKLRASFDIPVLYVSHALEEVARLADHLVILHQGRVAAQGPLNEVLSRIDLPHNPEDESAVVISGKIVERDQQWQLARFVFNGGELWLRDGEHPVNRPVRVQVFARDVSISLSPQRDSSILNRIPVTVVQVSQGDDPATAVVRLQVGDQFLLAKITRKSAHLLQLAVGKQVWAQIKSAALLS